MRSPLLTRLPATGAQGERQFTTGKWLDHVIDRAIVAARNQKKVAAHALAVDHRFDLAQQRFGT
jgi:hypothetical protein